MEEVLDQISPRSLVPSEATYQIRTFGCKVNQYDSQQYHDALNKMGYREAEGPEVPEYTIISACTVTSKGLSRAREIARRRKREFPNTKLVITGCISDEEQETMKSMTEVDLIVPHLEKFDILAKLFKDESLKIDPYSPVAGLSGRTRSFLKVQDGCDQYCTYCRIPYVRSKLWSKPIANIVEEARLLANNGFKELVLTGIHIGHYYRTSEENKNLADVLRALLEVENLPRIRVSSIEVLEVTSEMIDLIAANPRICPHFHIPLQSGSNRILKLMGRAYKIEEYMKVINEIKSKIKQASFSADVIVGFPHESDEDFQNTIDIVNEVEFSSLHVFPFSVRPDTGAYNLKKHVHGTVKSERVEFLISHGNELRKQYEAQFLDSEVSVLIESSDGSGFTDRYVKVFTDADEEDEGKILKVKILEQKDGLLYGNIIR